MAKYGANSDFSLWIPRFYYEQLVLSEFLKSFFPTIAENSHTLL